MARLAKGMVRWGKPVFGEIEGEAGCGSGREATRIAQRRREAVAQRGGGARVADHGPGRVRDEIARFGEVVHRGSGKNGVGLVAAGADSRIVTLGWGDAGDGALQPGDKGG